MLDEESFYDVCPEVLTAHIARRCPYGTVVDPFCGAGGNAIQLALTCREVIAVDVDSEKIKIARRNAAIYGVAHKIDFRIGDSFVVLSGVSADVVVTSPPWSGSYNVQNVCSREEGGMAGVLKMAHRIAPRVVLRLPKTIDRTQCLNVSRAADFGRVEFECVTIDECPDSVTVYLKSRPNDISPLRPVITSKVNLNSGRWKYRQNGKDGLAVFSAYLDRTIKFLKKH